MVQVQRAAPAVLMVAALVASCGTAAQGESHASRPATLEQVRIDALSLPSRRPTHAQALLAARTTDLSVPSGEVKDRWGVPPSWAHGIVGFTREGAGTWTVHVGAEADPRDVRALVLEGLPADSARSLRVRRSTASISELRRAWVAVGRGDWRTRPNQGYGMSVDARSGVIELSVSGLDAATRSRIEAIGDGVVEPSEGGVSGRSVAPPRGALSP